jgi:hypothetical protein
MSKSLIQSEISRVAAMILLAASGRTAWAAPEEIQVYMDEMNAPREIALDIHSSYVFSGSRAPDYPGAQAPRHLLRVTPEFSYGLTPVLELGAYVLFARDASGNSAMEGQKLRLKYIAPKDPEQAYFAGANLEIGRVEHRVDENPWNAELKGIFGYRSDRWEFAVNPNIGWKISGPAPAPTSFDLDFRIAYRTGGGNQAGIESYNELGEIGRLGHLNRHSQTLYAVFDTSIQGWELNLGLGRGLSSAADRLLLKLIVSVPLGK